MQVVYDESFNNLVKACILQEVKGFTPVTKPDLKSKDFTRVSDYEMNELLIEWDWVHGTPHNISNLERAVQLAIRHKFADNNLIFSVIIQALRFGVEHVLTRSTPEAKRFCNLVCAVREELRNAKFNMKFSHKGKTLIGKYIFSHQIADLLLQFYQKRFPEKEVVIINNFSSFSLNGDSLIKKPVFSNPISSQVRNQPPVTLSSFF